MSPKPAATRKRQSGTSRQRRPSPARDRLSLVTRQALFVDEFLVDRNTRAAAIRAGYSAKTAPQIGYQLIKKPAVAAAIAEAERERIERVRQDQDWSLKAAIAVYETAFRIGDLSAANKANELVARLQGKLVERTVTVTVTLEDLLAQSRAIGKSNSEIELDPAKRIQSGVIHTSNVDNPAHVDNSEGAV